jgi:Zn-dependent protease
MASMLSHLGIYGKAKIGHNGGMGILTIYGVAILVLSVVVHEVAHGWMALRCGDNTAYRAGRLTLNPLRHLDMVGSIIVPFITAMLNIPFGWAKPVPYNVALLRRGHRDEVLVALAGPVSNLLIAFLAGMAFRLIVHFYPIALAADSRVIWAPALTLLMIIVITNVSLAVFNMIPLPPLDGSKVLFAMMSSHNRVRQFLNLYPLVGILFVVVIVWPLLDWIIPLVSYFFTGMRIG